MTQALPTDLIVQVCGDKKWQYPTPVEDVDAWLQGAWDAFDPRYVHHIYWPDRPYKPEMDILVVDGGTTQGPVIARTNPNAKVMATVASEASLAHAIYLRHKFGLVNLELHLLPVERISALDQSFDLIIASGALQNADSADVTLGIQTLGQKLRPEGVVSILLYSGYVAGNTGGRLATEPAPAPLHSGGVNLSVASCLELVEAAGLTFQDWLFKSPYYVPASAIRDNPSLEWITQLSEAQTWSFAAPLRNQTGCHLFTACRPERPVEKYRIDFANPTALNYVPGWRFNACLDGHHAVGPNGNMRLDSIQREFAMKIDGYSTIRDLAGDSRLETTAVELFKEMWRMDLIVIGLTSDAA